MKGGLRKDREDYENSDPMLPLLQDLPQLRTAGRKPEATWASLAAALEPNAPETPEPSSSDIIRLAKLLFEGGNAASLRALVDPFILFLCNVLQSSFTHSEILDEDEDEPLSGDLLNGVLLTVVVQKDQQMDIWDRLLNSPHSVQRTGSFSTELFQLLWDLCWRADWKLLYDGPMPTSVYVNIIKCATFCSLLLPDLQKQTAGHFSGILNGLASFEEFRVSKFVYFAIVEGLGILSVKYFCPCRPLILSLKSFAAV